MELISRYFPELSPETTERIRQLLPLYRSWNARVNLVSRKDFDHFYERHVLHSLSLTRVCRISGCRSVMDLGTGGGFPGIPLAILHPDTSFTLVDATRKKITAVQDIAQTAGLENVTAIWSRVEDLNGNYDLVVTRAVASLDLLFKWTRHQTRHLAALKGGDLSGELAALPRQVRVKTHSLSAFIAEPYFSGKTVVELAWD